MLTHDNIDDRTVVEYLDKTLKGWLFNDRGFISKRLAVLLANHGLELIIKIRSNMKEKVIHHIKTLLLSKRHIIEIINNQLKYLFHINCTRHRFMHFQTNFLSIHCLLIFLKLIKFLFLFQV
ncbi:transposase [Orientia tsutsugamushi]|uniref:transposase n=1 Tax=Orientia tsutsugamushi TaxID=784 RepID=UPI0039795F09